eukprot:scaffold216336_cov47-Attheya_sp.AAC.1
MSIAHVHRGPTTRLSRLSGLLYGGAEAPLLMTTDDSTHSSPYSQYGTVQVQYHCTVTLKILPM